MDVIRRSFSSLIQVVHAALSFDHARGSLLHGVSNDQLEQRLGPSPGLPSAEERAAAVSRSVGQLASDEEVVPFEAAILPLLTDQAVLQEQSAFCRRTFCEFAREHQGALGRMLDALGHECDIASLEPNVASSDTSGASGASV